MIIQNSDITDFITGLVDINHQPAVWGNLANGTNNAVAHYKFLWPAVGFDFFQGPTMPAMCMWTNYTLEACNAALSDVERAEVRALAADLPDLCSDDLPG